MSQKIPYNFSMPVPNYFSKNGWFTKNSIGQKNRLFVHWICCETFIYSRSVLHNGGKIHLEPWEFLYTNTKVKEDLGLTRQEFEDRMKKCSKDGLISKVEAKSNQKHTVFRWCEEALAKKSLPKDATGIGDKIESKDAPKDATLLLRVNRVNNVVVVRAQGDESENDIKTIKEESMNPFTKDGLFFKAIKTKQDWETKEIEDAWLIFEKVDCSIISDPFQYIGGIIQKNRNKKLAQTKKTIKDKQEKSKGKSKCNKQTSVKKQENGSSKTSENVTSELPLAKYARLNGHNTK